MSSRLSSLERFYELLGALEVRCGVKRQLAHCDGRMGWPGRGVYFFFENGELRDDGSTPRVVRVGTHALRPSMSSLWGRLSQHKGSTSGSMPGGGNHRSSIFRLHVGGALLTTGEWPTSIRRSWSVGSTAPPEVRMDEFPLERAVTANIGAMPFLWLEVNDPPGAESDRGVIEAGAIALLSNFDREPIDASSLRWLGRRSERALVRASGLWNVNHVRNAPSDRFLGVLEKYLRAA